MSFSSDYGIYSRAHLAGSAALLYCWSGEHPNLCCMPLATRFEGDMHIDGIALVAGSPGRALYRFFSLKNWSALMWHAFAVTEPFPGGQVVESGGQRRSAFFPIVLRMLAEGYRR